MVGGKRGWLGPWLGHGGWVVIIKWLIILRAKRIHNFKVLADSKGGAFRCLGLKLMVNLSIGGQNLLINDQHLSVACRIRL